MTKVYFYTCFCFIGSTWIGLVFADGHHYIQCIHEKCVGIYAYVFNTQTDDVDTSVFVTHNL